VRPMTHRQGRLGEMQAGRAVRRLRSWPLALRSSKLCIRAIWRAPPVMPIRHWELVTGFDAVPLDQLKRRIQGVVDRKGGIEILQLSGGEPTLHPQFFELLDGCRTIHASIMWLLNTNGVRIARDDEFARELGAAFRYGAFQLYLQFDGVQAQGQEFFARGDCARYANVAWSDAPK